MRETLTSYTATTFVESENHNDLRNALILLSAELKGFHSEIRVDPAPGLASLRDDVILKQKGITIVPGDEKNKNKIPVAERAVQEIEMEILRIQPEKGQVSRVTLAIATANTNSRVRRDGLSSRELWTQRDQITGSQLPFDDETLMSSQSSSRRKNHLSSAKSKAKGKGPNSPVISVGDLVYLVSERSKNQARDKYLVTNISGNSCTVRKFTRNQFRRKQYSIPITSVFPIIGGVQSLPPVHNPSSSSESDDEVLVDEPIDTILVDSGSESEGEVEGEDGGEDVHNLDIRADEDLNVEEGARRSKRDAKPPAWHKDYEMGSFS